MSSAQALPASSTSAVSRSTPPESSDSTATTLLGFPAPRPSQASLDRPLPASAARPLPAWATLPLAPPTTTTPSATSTASPTTLAAITSAPASSSSATSRTPSTPATTVRSVITTTPVLSRRHSIANLAPLRTPASLARTSTRDVSPTSPSVVSPVLPGSANGAMPPLSRMTTRSPRRLPSTSAFAGSSISPCTRSTTRKRTSTSQLNP